MIPSPSHDGGRRAAVLGSPIAHSLSPALHRAAYAVLGLDWRYDAVDVTEVGLPAFLARLGPEWAGLSLTMPLKATVLDLLDEVTPQAAMLRSVNTVVLREGRRQGSNTDVPGMVAALLDAGVGSAGTVTILGGGATGRSALATAAALGATSVHAVVRDPARHRDRLAALGVELSIPVRIRPWSEIADALVAPLVVSTVPAGAGASLSAALPSAPGLLFDVLYDPWPTPLAVAWSAAGGVVIGGLDLLVRQAALQVEAMTGRPAPVEAMRAAGVAALVARGGQLAP